MRVVLENYFNVENIDLVLENFLNFTLKVLEYFIIVLGLEK
jgi:hypothetical protein